MKYRARLLLWLGKVMGLMTDAPQSKEMRMEWSQDQIMSIIGTKEVEIIGLRMQLTRATELLRKYEEKHGPILEEVKKDKAA